ncbi:hypothetical protein MC378_14020 [Polaribacter sp. MSW13]|uniref:Uncharacterized protein n=1 Tax=Polaribacter marinus TaxID=2916838 RepID=A0A9X2AKB3_9FLAO|nr:hypothetical protein [Polaribacter marinus]MCI2230291.1 hypothetical protein [Polaribacter marinus]
MENLYILTKQEFTSLYRFGTIPLISNKIISTVNLSSEEINSKIYEGFLSLPYFVGDEEYLIISFENVLKDNTWLEIEYVEEVIPLTKAAKNSFEMKFDDKLDFKDARFENIVHKIEEQIDIQERYRGSKAFWILCQVKSEYEPLLTNELIESSYHKRINAIKSSEFKDDFFIHLLAYDRYEFFPNSDLGYYYDIGEIFAHSKGKTSFKGSSFHSFLENNKQALSEKSFVQIAQIISDSNDVTKFTEQLTSNGLRQYLASAIFLKFKNDLAERDTIKDSATGRLIGEIRKDKQFINELNLAIYLTGSFFGYKKFYDDLYDLVDLKIFKKKVKLPQEDTNVSKKHDKIEPVIESVPSTTIKPEIKSSKFENTEQSKLSEVKDKNEIIEKVVTGKEQVLKEQVKTSTSDYSGVQKQILDMLLRILDEEKGSFEIKTDRLNELKKILSPLSVEKTISKKDDVVQIIKEKFSDRISIEAKGKKYIIGRKTENDLFANA